jgi:hypothetical protein
VPNGRASLATGSGGRAVRRRLHRSLRQHPCVPTSRS